MLIKQITISLMILFLSTSIYAHCGSCGTGAPAKKIHKKQAYSQHTKKVIKSLKLNKEQSKKFDKVTDQYKKDITRIQDRYYADLKLILTKKQFRKYKKKFK
ncbi:hypothetical protein DID75_05715 [Candidatus Marinamargulisbacteria bacterium SCGC AG-410-N11]|nr:hypothetical protein DID75_05715 [Candidatus Marinamargulisbacteria bacterium SCGC AG-410-N11]